MESKKAIFKRIGFSVAINLILILLLNSFFIATEKTDDFIMKCILEGVFSGKSDGHLLYFNYFYGAFLSAIQSILPGVAWITVSQYILIFISFCIVTYYVITNNNMKTGLLILLPVLLFFGFEAYIKITFSKTAAIGIAAGIFWMYERFKRERFKIWQLLPGLILSFWGTMYRNKTLYMTVAVMAGIILYEVVVARKSGIKILIKKAVIMCIPIGLLLVGTYAAKIVGSAMFVRDAGWANYKEYNTYKVELQDYGWPDYLTYRDQYEALGISENDYEMWNNRDYADSDILTIQLLSDIASIKTSGNGVSTTIIDSNGASTGTSTGATSNIGFNSLKGYLTEYPLEFLDLNVCAGLLAIWAVMIILLGRKSWFTIGYSFFVAMLLEYYLYCGGRYGRQHVDVGIFFGMTLFCLYFVEHKRFKVAESSIMVILIAVILIQSVKLDQSYMTTPTYTGTTNTVDAESAHRVMDILSADKENLYILSNDEYYGLMRGYGAFERVDAGELSNIFILSSYMYPSHNVVLENYGKEHVYEALLDDNVFYATSYGQGNVKTILTYICEHYEENVSYTLVQTIDNIRIYKFERM